ncbi:MAG: nucleotidyltransferase family protein [Candidatus Zambryskibacteria bacterium]|nr:nucleotidyltransferase family protein [Candidatus Zambryskibacteria bacterium]
MNQIEEIKEKITPILEKYGVTYAGVFGSVARGEAKKNSDVDILVYIKRPIGLFKFFGLKYELEDILEKKVDLVSKEAINRHIKPYILADLKPIYEVR